MSLSKVAYTIVDDVVYYPGGTHIFINSFKKFHPDIDLVVFRQDMIDKVFRKKKINFYQAKPTFAKLLYDKYDLVVNMDCDHVVCGRMIEVFDKVDYEVAMPWNKNDYEASSVENITEDMYLQGGMIASTRKDFWDKYETMNKDAFDYDRRENDIVNLLIYNEMKIKLKILDKDKDYYGCKALGREPEFYIEKDKLMCRKEQVVSYHFARGGVFPKLNFKKMPFKDEVKEWLDHVSMYGQSIKIGGI